MDTVSTSTNRILVIEDQSSIRELVADLLREFELADIVEEANSLHDARLAILSGQWDAIITDMSLGDGNILDLLESLKQQGHCLPPILLMSGYLFDQSQQRARSLGIAHILPKPFAPADMINSVLDMTGSD